MLNNKIKVILFYFVLLFSLFFHYNITNAQSINTTNTKNSILTNSGVQNNLYNDKEKEMLEKTINILDKTNTSLTQQWTPISILLSIIAGLFALVTLLWAGVFAWGYIIFRKIASDKKKMALEMKKLSNEGKKILEGIDVSGKKIFAEVEEKSKTIPELKKELNDFKEDARQAIEKFEDKTIGTISGSNQGVYGEATFGTHFFGNNISSDYSIGGLSSGINNLKICSRCGNAFKENVGFSALSEISLHSYVFSNNVLCKKCKEEESKK